MTLKSWRSKEAEKEDKEKLAKHESELKGMLTRKTIFGGGKTHSGVFNAGVRDDDMSELEETIKREKADEAMYERDRGYKEHR